MKYGLHGKLSAKKGEGDKLATILSEASKLVINDPGCFLYLVSKDKERPEDIWVTEVWDSKETHDTILQKEDVRALIGQAMPILDGMPQKGIEMSVIEGA